MSSQIEEILKPEADNFDNVSSIEKNDLQTTTRMPTQGTNTPDEIAQFQEDGLEYSDQEVKKLVSKLDWIIIPLIGICYIFFYIDKTTLSYAAIFGLKDDLKLVGTQYSWLSAIFYLGYLCFAFLNNFFLIKLPVGRFLGFNIFMWGVLLMFQTACNSFAGLMVVRFFGGAFESVADPAYMLITSMFYTKREQPLRIGAWYCFNGVGIAFGGLLGYAIGHIPSSKLPSWKYEFLIIGAACTFWGICIFILMPNSPLTTKYITTREKKILIDRLRDNQTGLQTKIFKWYQVKEALLDPKMYCLFFSCLFSNIPNGVVSNFGTLIIQGLGFNKLVTTTLQIPYGAFIVLCILSCVWLNDFFIIKLKKNLRCVFIVLYIIPNIVGGFGLRYIPLEGNRVGKLICYYLTGSYNASFVLLLSLSTANIAGHTKRIVFNAAIFLGYCVGNIAGPFMAKSSQASEGYPFASSAMFFSNFMQCACIILFGVYCRWENYKRDKEQGILNVEGGREKLEVHGFDDLTDMENRSFRYVY